MDASEQSNSSNADAMCDAGARLPPEALPLAGVPMPAWIYSLDDNAFRWANGEGLAFWGATDATVFSSTDPADTRAVTLARLGELRERLRSDGPVTEIWTLYPQGLPRTIACTTWGVDWQGETCVAFLALPALSSTTEEELRLRDDVLKAVAESAQRLLHGGGWVQEGNELLKALGRAAKVDRCYFFRFLPRGKDKAGDDWWTARQEFEWCAPGIKPEIDNPILQNLNMVAAGFGRWIERFERGEAVVASGPEQIPQAERVVLDPQGVHAICLQPVLGDGDLLGFVGFDIVGKAGERPFAGWTSHVVDALATGAHLVAAALKMDRTQRQLTQALAKAEAASQAKSHFLAAISHELRTPLNAINGFSQMMEHQVLGPLGDRRYEGYAHDIHTSGEHLLALINDILDMSKIEAGRMTLNETSLSLAEAVSTALGLVREAAEARGLSLCTDMAETLPRLWADERAVRQMLINLLSNAVKFTPDGGRVTVSAHRGAAGGLALVVADTGVGIAPEDQATIMEPFRQGRFERPASAGGTGLGLALVKSLIELHGGAIELSSRVGTGTTVTLRFPADRVRER